MLDKNIIVPIHTIIHPNVGYLRLLTYAAGLLIIQHELSKVFENLRKFITAILKKSL